MTGPARRLAAVALVALLVATPVQAFIIPDPVENAFLAKIAATLEAIQQFRMRVMARLEEEVYTRINAYAFPTRLFGGIRATVTGVTDIRSELQRLGCEWPALPRVARLQEMLLRRSEFCRPDFQLVWGTHEAFWDGPLQETNDYVATMTANMISERVERTSASWVHAHRDLFDEHTILRGSPGEANRAEAVALAWVNEVAVGNSQVATQNLLVKQMARDLDRFDEKKAADVTFYTYQGLATLAGAQWQSAPPDPTDGIPR